MIGTLFVVGVILAVGVTIVAIVIGGLFSPAKLLLALIGTGTAVVIAVVVTVVLTPVGRAPAMNDFSHAQLEADRVMTKQMATVVGPGMDAQMETNGMLQRSSNDAYLRALEEHIYQVDRMLGQVP